jgi:hypothetical protein
MPSDYLLWLKRRREGGARRRPSLVRPVESALRAVSRGVFAGLLTIVYFCVLTPVGLVMRMVRGRAPFYFGQGPPEGWTPKIIDEEAGTNYTDD